LFQFLKFTGTRLEQAEQDGTGRTRPYLVVPRLFQKTGTTAEQNKPLVITG